MLGFAALAEVAIAEIPGLPKPIGWADEWDRPAKFHHPLDLDRLVQGKRNFISAAYQEMIDEDQRAKTRTWYESSVAAMKERRIAFLARQRGR